MQEELSGKKSFRLLNIYERLNKGEILSKTKLAEDYAVTEKTVQRDFDDLRAYLSEYYSAEREIAIKYDRRRQGYYLVRFEREWLTNDDVLALCKILLESRAFCKSELDSLISKILLQVSPNDRKHVERIIQNEQFHYVPPRHGQKLLTPIWALSEFIAGNEIVKINYTRRDGRGKTHEIKPVAIMFSEYYFYLIAFMADGSKDFPTVFRVDRIKDIEGTSKKFTIPYKDKFSDGEFRKRVQFMYSGELRKVAFEYSGQAIEAVLDRFPTAEVLSEKDGVYSMKVEVYGDGIDMWFRSQGDNVKIEGA